MKRYQPPNPKDALPDELQAIWDAIRRMREATARSILPYDYEFDVAEDGDIRIVQNGAIVNIGGSTTTFELTQEIIDSICEECGGGDTTIVVEGGTGGLTTVQRIVNTNDTALPADGVLLCQQAAPITITLDATLTVANTIVVKDQLGAAGASPISIAAPGGFSIDGLPAYNLNVPYRAVTIGRAAGGDFFII